MHLRILFPLAYILIVYTLYILIFICFVHPNELKQVVTGPTTIFTFIIDFQVQYVCKKQKIKQSIDWEQRKVLESRTISITID